MKLYLVNKEEFMKLLNHRIEIQSLSINIREREEKKKLIPVFITKEYNKIEMQFIYDAEMIVVLEIDSLKLQEIDSMYDKVIKELTENGYIVFKGAWEMDE